jgi:hypothetical protein
VAKLETYSRLPILKAFVSEMSSDRVGDYLVGLWLHGRASEVEKRKRSCGCLHVTVIEIGRLVRRGEKYV